MSEDNNTPLTPSAATQKKAKSLRDEREEQEKALRDAQETQEQAKRVQQVIDSIKSLLAGRKITQSLVIRVVANCMLITAKMKVQNTIKKQIVIDALEKYIKEQSDLTQEEIDSLMTIVDLIVSEAIDTIADIKKSKLCCCSRQNSIL